jgi:leucyl-tRNA synthetase
MACLHSCTHARPEILRDNFLDSLSQAEFAVGYQRMKGKRCLWPFGFHCTGMPIQAAADRLKREMEGGEGGAANADDGHVDGDGGDGDGDGGEGNGGLGGGGDGAAAGKFTSSKSKLKDKAGHGSQWSVLESMGIPAEEIPKFRDAGYWLDYFPPIAKRDLQAMGCKIDWRRCVGIEDLVLVSDFRGLGD